jgi:methylenetetrahydrofolate reductase (NADPH)
MEAAHQSNTEPGAVKSYYLTAEIDPPKGTNLEGFLTTALSLRGRVDAVRVTDSEHAIMRMSPIAPCLALKERGMEPVMVMNGRDRNRISFQGDLLCASTLGIKNILLREGHDPAEGDQPVVRTSGDLDMSTMLKCISSLNAGHDLAGEPLDGATSFTVGVSLDLSDDATRNREQMEYIRKLAGFGVTSVSLGPTYDINIIEKFLPVAEETGIQLSLSVMLLKSVTMIRYLNNLKGVPSVPQEYLKKMMDAPVKQDAGLTIGAEFVREIAPMVDGIDVLALGWRDRLPEFLDRIGR